MMASSSGVYKEGVGKQGHGSASSSSYNGSGSSVVHGEWGVPTFQHQPTISMDWTLEEQAMLEDGLNQYASESNIIRYAKIAVQLKNKTVRDVALRCRWMTKKEISKRRKEDFNARKLKDRKDKFIDSSAKPSRLSIQSEPSRLSIQSGLSPGLSQLTGLVSNGNDDGISYNDVGGATRQLLQQNAWNFKQISANLATHQIHENIGLLSQARDNIFQILANLNEMGPIMKKLPQLPKLDEELANTILPPSTLPIQL